MIVCALPTERRSRHQHRSHSVPSSISGRVHFLDKGRYASSTDANKNAGGLTAASWPHQVASISFGEGDFTEGHELDRKWKVAKQMVGRRLSQAEAKRLLAKFA